MSIDSLRDGFVTLCLDSSLNYYSGKCRMFVEGQMASSATATADVPVVINTINDIDALFGIGSILGITLKKIWKMAGERVSITALPRADADSGVASLYTMTITGTATTPGRFTLFMLDNDYSVSFPVSVGDTPTTIAAALVAALPADFPYTAVPTAGVIVFTAINKGTVGNFLAPIYNWAGLQNFAPAGVSVAVVHTTPGATDPTGVNYANLIGSCCYDVYCLLNGTPAWQLAMENWIRAQWACNVPAGVNGAQPQCFGHGYTYNNGTLGDVLATGDNAEVFNRLAYPLNDANPPWFLVGCYAALSAVTSCTSPELSIQGPVDGLLTALSRPSTCQEPWSYSSRLTLDAAGFNVWGPLTNVASQLTSPYIYNDVTNSLSDALGRANATWRSATTRRWAAFFSNEFAQFLDNNFNGLSAFADGTQIRPGVFGTTKNMIRAKIVAWLKSVTGSLISPLQDIDKQVILTSSLETSPPCQGIPGNYALRLTVQPGVRINNIATTILPQLLTNCNNAAFTQSQQLAS